MSCINFHKLEINTNNLNLNNTKLRKPSLSAQWSIVDNKLVCNWLLSK